MRFPEKGFKKLRGHDLKNEVALESYWMAEFQEGKWQVRIAKEECSLSKGMHCLLPLNTEYSRCAGSHRPKIGKVMQRLQKVLEGPEETVWR